MNIPSILAIVAAGAALLLSACATPRPVETTEVAWVEARRLLEEAKAARQVAPAVPKAPAPAPAAPQVAATKARPPAAAPSPSTQRYHPARTTAYYHGEADHLAYGRKSALGTDLVYGDHRSAAADWSRYPMGTRFRIIGDHQPCEYRIDDYGKALVGTNTIDLYKPTRIAMDRWGCREVVIEVLEWGCFEKSLRIMEPRTHSPHVRRMIEAIRSRPINNANALAAIDPQPNDAP